MIFDKYEILKEISSDVLSITYLANQISKNEKVFLRVYKSVNITDQLIPQCESFLKKLTGITHFGADEKPRDSKFLRDRSKSSSCEAVENRTAGVLEGYAEERKRKTNETDGLFQRSLLSIIKTIDWFWQEKDLIIVEEFFEGETLENIFSKPSNLEINRVYKISQEILNLLAEAHKINLYHGSLSPREIILTDQGLKIRGWGIASILGRNSSAKTSSLVADAHYLAPEEIRGENGTEKIDIYLFGLILYQMCTGVFPFTGKTNVSVALRHLHDEPNKPTYLNPALPISLEKIITQCLQKDPQARPSAKNVLDSFKQISTNSSPLIFPELVSPSKNEDIFSLKENSAVVLGKKSAFTKGIIFLCVLFLGWYIYNSSFFIRGEIVVPTLYGMPLEKAVKLLAEKDLGSEIAGSIKSKELPVGAVVSQEPSGGRFVRAGRKIRLILSGESMVIVPDLIGESVAQAKEILKKYGLKPADQKLIEEKIIVGQNPAPGFEIPLNAKVSMETGYEFVSIKVPSFLQKTIFDAEEIADKESLEIGKVVYQKSTVQEKDFVIDQNPLPQENMPRGAKIDLVIGQGEEGEDHQLKRAVVEFTVPSQTSSKEYNLKIDVVDDLGEFSVFENLFRPSETVKYSVLGVGAAKVRIFLDGVLKEEETL